MSPAWPTSTRKARITMPGNNGPREADYYLQALEAAAATAPEFETVTSENAGATRDAIDAISKLAKAAEQDRKALKDPYLESGRKIDASFKPVAAKAEAIVAPLKRALGAFLAEQERIKREAVDKARREAEAAQRAAEALKEDEFVASYASEKAAQAVKDAAYAEALAAQNTVKGTSDRAIGLRTYRAAKVANAAMLVAYYAAHPDVVALCERLANAEIRAAKGGDVSIPGVRIVEEKRVA